MYRRMYPENLDADGYPKARSLIHRDTVLSVYNKSTITHYRVLRTECCHGNQPWITEEFYIGDTDSPAILSYKTSLKMKLITVNFSITESTSRQDEATQPAVTSIEGLKHNWEFRGEYHIVLRPDAQPVIHAPWKSLIHLKEELKAELNTMESQGVIRKVLESTDWVRSLMVSRKNNGQLRIYLNPTLEEITHKFTGATVFSTLDAKSGYWSVKLNDESSLLTTFHTPFGRYCYHRMPFGLVIQFNSILYFSVIGYIYYIIIYIYMILVMNVHVLN